MIATRYDVGAPDLVGALDREAPQQIGEDLVPWRGLAGAGLRPERLDPHLAHQPLHALAVDGMALGAQHRRHPPRAEERPTREQFIDPPHQRRIVIIVGGRSRPIDA